MKNTGTLKVTLSSDSEIVMTRVFDAPRHLVYDAFSKPELLKRWFGPRGWSLSVCEVDPRVGGGFRFVLRGPGGRELGMRGVYRELAPPKRSVHMESFDDFPGESQVTAVFTEQEGKTTLTVTVLYPSKEVRDAVLKDGMEHGAAESYDRLAALLAGQQGRREITLPRRGTEGAKERAGPAGSALLLFVPGPARKKTRPHLAKADIRG
jgi:uncharacterized protein YndB with AHSA1/START domain